ncbi:MAG: hypothetical protein HN576_08770 [Bacteriovoracaceae bacterium]|jgi:hypothetical protein|nr:hypothetical protein [Bacteriovoracaceae bacterium]
MENNLILEQLQSNVRSYLDKNKRISLNGLSKRCAVSEPTLRRIMNGKIKTLPMLSTIIDILCTLNKADSVNELITFYEDTPIGEFLSNNYSVLSESNFNYEFSAELNEALRDNVSYLIYKLSANRKGVTAQKIEKLFGHHGMDKLKYLHSLNLVTIKLDIVRSVTEGFSLSHDQFIPHFKAVSDFIKTEQSQVQKKNLFYNFSESINEQAHKEILSIQKAALKKITKILNDDSNSGDTPIFILSAVDTLDVEDCGSESQGLLH